MKYLIALAAMTAISGAAVFAGEKKDDMKCMDMGKHMGAKAEDHFKAVDADADGLRLHVGPTSRFTAGSEPAVM